MYIAYDTETELIPDRTTLRMGTRKIRLEPFAPPGLVCVSAADSHGVRLYGAGDGVGEVERALRDHDCHLVFHNAAFDIHVLVAAGVDPLAVKQAVRERRIHDTMFMDMLLGLAKGKYDTPVLPNFEYPQLRPRSLDVLAQEYLGITLDKDPAIRLAYGQYRNQPVSALPPSFQKYAKEDAQATYDVWNVMIRGLDEKLLSEPLQTAASLALAPLDQTGTRIDTEEAQRLLPMFERDLPELEAELIRAGLGREGVVDQQHHTHETVDEVGHEHGDWVWDLTPSIWHPMGDDGGRVRLVTYKTNTKVKISYGRRSFHLNFNEIRSRLEELEKELKIKAPRSETGLISMDAEWWAERLPADAHALHTWQKRQKLEKILNTYLRLYSQVDRVFANWNILGARSGRMSCSAPNIQNVPKRHHGIRSLFRPDDGHVFVVTDYCYQELVTLADTMAHMGIRGPLLKALEDDIDPHINTVVLTSGVAYEDVTREQRQSAKALNFGYPGGLGAAKFREWAKKTYGVTMTLDEAKEWKRVFFRAYPDIAEFISRMQTDFNAGLVRHSGRGLAEWKHLLGLDPHTWIREVKLAMLNHESKAIRMVCHKAERGVVVSLPSGRIRKGPTFTEAANSMFQGPASDVSKLAVVHTWLRGMDTKLVVHDELVGQCYLHDVQEYVKNQEDCMLQAFRELCPVAGRFAKVETKAPLDRWGPATDKEGKVI